MQNKNSKREQAKAQEEANRARLAEVRGSPPVFVSLARHLCLDYTFYLSLLEVAV